MRTILAIELEPTPYKYDLWNAVSRSYSGNILVIFTEIKDTSKDSGHDYKLLPLSIFKSIQLDCNSFLKTLYESARLVYICKKIKNKVFCISGYSKIQLMVIIIYAVLFNCKFCFIADVFNNNNIPDGILKNVKIIFRNVIRKIVFNYAQYIFVCGSNGVKSALIAGCDAKKIYDFPYTIDISRLKESKPIEIPFHCLMDISNRNTILFFSGRMIPRKGLPSLLRALNDINTSVHWKLWIEGDGPYLDEYKLLAKELGVSSKCNFLGFHQHDLHSWFIKSAKIIIVPSLEDNWGIVVDEALQLGKAVISTEKTGSAIDRIKHGKNGFLIPADNSELLAKHIELLINNSNLCKTIEKNALLNTKKITSSDNARLLIKIINDC